MAGKLTRGELRAKAAQAGLKLSDDELQRLLPGVNRARKQVADLREILTENTEPASGFSALKANKV